jgi:hypothetical protein
MIKLQHGTAENGHSGSSTYLEEGTNIALNLV